MADLTPDAPADVVALFEWANVKGVAYRDFSASRRAYRAEMRHRAALARRDAELKAKAEAELAAAEADYASRQAMEQARVHAVQARRAAERQRTDEATAEEAARERALLHADQLSRRAAAERMEVARHAEALRAAEQAARSEALELTRARAFADPRRSSALPDSGVSAGVGAMGSEENKVDPLRVPAENDPDPDLAVNDPDLSMRVEVDEGSSEFAAGEMPEVPPAGEQVTTEPSRPEPRSEVEEETLEGPPSWIADQPTTAAENGGRSAFHQTLQHSREKVAARWYALRRLLGASAPEEDGTPVAVPDQVAPVLVIYSVAGGVGKTSLAASLTRALAAQGERVLLVDTTGRGILPLFLGARESGAEETRTFAPPPGSPDRPIHLMSPGAASGGGQPLQSLAVRLRAATAGFSRVVVDIATGDRETLTGLLAAGADVLVPLMPDMNSAVSLSALRRVFASTRGGAEKAVTASFLMVQFDPSQPLHLDVRELLQGQLGASLLPFAIRRSPAMAEALAEGMTVIDYAPGEGIAKDILQLAGWVRKLTEPAREGLAQARWRER